jgi:hypothetical protein
MMPWCMNFPFKKIKILVPPQPHIWPKVSLVSPFSVSLVNNTRKRNLHTQKKFASKKLESIGVQVHSLDNRDHSKKKTEKKEKAEKEKETRSQSQILPTYHSFIHPRRLKKTYLPTNRTRSSVCCHFHPLTWWMKIYVYARNISSTILGGGVW